MGPTSANTSNSFQQTSSPTLQLQSAALESSSTLSTSTASSSLSSALEQPTLSHESSNVEDNHETVVLEQLCIEDHVMVDDPKMPPSSTLTVTAEQRTDILPQSTLPDPAASTSSTVSLVDSADKITEVQEQVEVRLVPDTTMDSKVETLEQLIQLLMIYTS